MDTIPKLSYPDSMKLIREAAKRDQAIFDLIDGIRLKTREEATKAVNKLLYDTAMEQNVSLYTLCFHSIPEYGIPEINYEDYKKLGDDGDLRTIITQTIKLKPIEFDFEHDGGYWKNKYYELKKQIQEIINEPNT